MADARSFFEEVASWSIEALDEDIARYFYHFDEVSLIESGKKNLVIGRKGTGKTAIAEYIRNKNPTVNSARLLSFKNFPFNQMYSLSDPNYTTPNQYISIWEYVIYCTICQMMVTDKRVDPLRRKQLADLFEFDIENALSESIKKISDRSFNLSVLGVGGGVGEAGLKDNSLNFESRNIILREYIARHISADFYYILFDALDEDYKGVLQPDRKEKYFDLLICLMKAVQNVRRHLKINSNIIPLVFLRDDIFDLCRDPDKNKWLDRAIILNWSEGSLKDLLAHRLSRALESSREPRAFSDVWLEYFPNSVRLRRRYGKSEDAFKYMLRATYRRPRDLVSYIRECAKIALEENLSIIPGWAFKKANVGHSEYLRREVIDETYSILDNISEILDLLAEQRKSIFTQEEFRSIYNDRFSVTEADSYKLSADKVLKLLYHFNVIGNVLYGSNHQVYSYSSNNKKLNPRENVCVHVGLLKSMDIL